MIRLTKLDGKPILINPNCIVAIETLTNDSDETLVYTVETEEATKVKESIEEVASKVLEWRLAMEDYRIYTQRASIDGDYDVASKCYVDLKRLAGLEETKDA